MKIGVTGPTSVSKIAEILGIEEEQYYVKVRRIAEFLATTDHKIFIVPFRKSVSEFFAEVYAEEDGQEITGIVPEDDDEFGITLLNRAVCDNTINCQTWNNAPPALLKNIDVLLVLGFGRNAFIHMGYSSLYKIKKIIILEDLISARLPEEMENGLKIEYVKSDELHKALCASSVQLNRA